MINDQELIMLDINIHAEYTMDQSISIVRKIGELSVAWNHRHMKIVGLWSIYASSLLTLQGRKASLCQSQYYEGHSVQS